MGDRSGAYRVLMGIPEGKRPLARPRRRWEDHNKMDLEAVGLGDRTILTWPRRGARGGHV
jgi:hypothetical protein